ncbi:hypothetical protein F2Q69_00027605 [Brassica cretica]|uniref:Uncharacterized protein n=1 Tax=Brassica cretica TaxID=69181 RepID=A0A8S9SBT6_BRACR|nr:hypothetical protein F2Q69_00027605 [Brassica cretica]
MWFTSQDYESEEEDDLESSLYHNFFEEGEDYSDQSYDVSSECNDSYEVASDDIQEISDTSPVPDEQRSRIATMAEIFKTMFQGGQSSSTAPLPNLKTTKFLPDQAYIFVQGNDIRIQVAGVTSWYFGNDMMVEKMAKEFVEMFKHEVMLEVGGAILVPEVAMQVAKKRHISPVLFVDAAAASVKETTKETVFLRHPHLIDVAAFYRKPLHPPFFLTLDFTASQIPVNFKWLCC